MAGITAERDEYGAVPPRPSRPWQRSKNCPIRGRWQASRWSVMSTLVSHHGRARPWQRSKNCPIRGTMAGITVERDEYGAVPPRPSAAEAAEQELSHSGAMAGITGSVMSTVLSHHGRAQSWQRSKNCPIRGRWQSSRRSVMSTVLSHHGRLCVPRSSTMEARSGHHAIVPFRRHAPGDTGRIARKPTPEGSEPLAPGQRSAPGVKGRRMNRPRRGHSTRGTRDGEWMAASGAVTPPGSVDWLRNSLPAWRDATRG